MEPIEPLNEFIVKIASRCNLDCDYCYEYNLGDDSWKAQPKFMADSTVTKLAGRIREHAIAHGVKRPFISLHGGEPLLVGATRLDRICQIFCDVLAGVADPVLTLQTNGLLLSEQMIEVIARRQIHVSVSIDGVKAFHDKHRIDHRGRGSYDRAMDGINLLKRIAPSQLTGVLSVIDVESDPIDSFDAIAELGVDWVDFLLPHANWDSPPPRPNQDPVAYGRWYWALYKAWVSDRHPSISIRFLVNIIGQLAGGKSIFEAMTLNPCTLITVATDGGLEGVDCLKSTGSGIQKLGVSIDLVSFDTAIRHRLVSVRQSGENQLASKCLACEFKQVCAGGYFPHRWSKDNQFNNESVYCEDLAWLIRNIRADLGGRVKEKRHSYIPNLVS